MRVDRLETNSAPRSTRIHSRPNRENERFGSELRAEPTPTKTGQHTRESRITHQQRAETPVQVRTDLRSAGGRREWSGSAAGGGSGGGRARPRRVAWRSARGGAGGRPVAGATLRRERR
ncbi:hypothetical protein PVAP13_5KG434307 [Panicum virgatum]|uniref:Uncharacterized protein n=1 Tax=Panicum virgatum TaxID=38727 RepID=A0A8T0SMD6_PANVG|nr:hypothetical protein PVAP13_5KG434307 [Panicum virgatum]